MSSEDEIVARLPQRLGAVLRGKYRLDALLGVGGMASVFAATHLRNANRVAVKILHPELSVDAFQRARFLREGYAANSVGHPGAVRVLDDDSAEDGAVFLVMELLEGESLDDLWERSGHRIAVPLVLTLLRELLEVLAAAHAKGIVHRDIKPRNLFLTHEGRLKVLDFGVARMRETSSVATASGALFGTPAFMPPEQALGRRPQVDAASDVWAVGATVYSLLSGAFVHEAGTPEEMLVAAATRTAPPLTRAAPHVPPPIARVIDRALSFNKQDRWPDAGAMLEALAVAEREASHTKDAAFVASEEGSRFAEAPTVRVTSADAAPPPGVVEGRRTRGLRLVAIIGATSAACAAALAASVSARHDGKRPAREPNDKGAARVEQPAVAATLSAGGAFPVESSTALLPAPVVSAATDASSPRVPTPPRRPARGTPPSKRDPLAP